MTNRHIAMLEVIDECIEFMENINPQPQDCDKCIALMKGLKILMKIDYKTDKENNNDR